ncbi:hypothetical protein J2858_001850 [Neorhizobium galegae]|uniref:DUF930 domain-containing protein n=1 Tax=Neorhizobium galegae TaxID=399 RepID=UPI001AE0FA48|nr:DUF930 domain-containing protein [Neorhizobium galegae]MBP2548934.1 hypothetical protein [Neorhizobium galegae]
MAKPTRRLRSGWGLGATSALLHLLVLAVFLIPFPSVVPDVAQEEAVSVEIVPPAEEPDSAKDAPPPAAPQPQEKPQEQAPPPPQATMIAAPPPPPSDQPERNDQSGQTQAKDEPAPVEAAPLAKDDPDKAPPAAPDPAAQPGTSPASPPQETAKPSVPPPVETQAAAEPHPEQQPAEAGAPLPDDVSPPQADFAPGLADGKPSVQPTDAVQAVPVPTPRLQPVSPTPEPQANPGGAMTKADTLLSDARLQNPALKAALGQLPPKRRLTQICSFEVAEQVARARPETTPDFIMPYGPSGGFIRNSTLDADGGAFRSGGRWFDVSFQCTVDMKTMKVTSFSYRLGGEVPQKDWQRRRLPGA